MLARIKRIKTAGAAMAPAQVPESEPGKKPVAGRVKRSARAVVAKAKTGKGKI